jgi:hypothetical protein
MILIRRLRRIYIKLIFADLFVTGISYLGWLNGYSDGD